MHARVILIAALSAAFLAAPAGAQSPGDLSGVWELDAAASDTIALPSIDSSRDRRGGVRIGIGGRSGRIPPNRSIQDPERQRQAIEAVRVAPARVFVVRGEGAVTISFDAHPPITLDTDGRSVDRFWTDHEEVEVRARWKDGALLIERELGSGLEIADTYSLDGEDRLTVHTIVEGPIPRRIELRRVYDRASSDR
jgi:hypothetical protein